MVFDLTDKLVWVAGQHGMIGGARMRRRRKRCTLLRNLGRPAVDLRRQSEVDDAAFAVSLRRERAVSRRLAGVNGRQQVSDILRRAPA
jgi:hypothetical protein